LMILYTSEKCWRKNLVNGEEVEHGFSMLCHLQQDWLWQGFSPTHRMEVLLHLQVRMDVCRAPRRVHGFRTHCWNLLQLCWAFKDWVVSIQSAAFKLVCMMNTPQVGRRV
jgi:hypothetical protein